MGRTVAARSWCRVDLAGGTLDIWPLGLLHPGAVTVNLAIDLPVTCRLSAAPADGGYRVEMTGRGEAGEEVLDRDQADAERSAGAPATVREAASAADLQADPATQLVGHLLEALAMPPVTLNLESASPRGAGLGASSALAVAIVAACEAWLGDGVSADGSAEPAEGPTLGAAARRVAVARDVEARLMGLPTGIQDHWPGQLGGALAIAHPVGGSRVRRIAVDLTAMGDRLLLAYTGVSHFSAGQNWRIVRRRLDGEAEVSTLFANIARVAREVEAALSADDLPRLGALVGEEWSLRRQLAPGVSVPAVEDLLDAARDAGAWGGKACGAGGGGCVVVLAPPDRRDDVAEALVAAGGELLRARPTASGLEVRWR